MISFDTWKIRANRDLKERFGIDFIDAGFDDPILRDGFNNFDEPTEWVTWFADKYALEAL